MNKTLQFKAHYFPITAWHRVDCSWWRNRTGFLTQWVLGFADADGFELVVLIFFPTVFHGGRFRAPWSPEWTEDLRQQWSPVMRSVHYGEDNVPSRLLFSMRFAFQMAVSERRPSPSGLGVFRMWNELVVRGRRRLRILRQEPVGDCWRRAGWFEGFWGRIRVYRNVQQRSEGRSAGLLRLALRLRRAETL